MFSFLKKKSCLQNKQHCSIVNSPKFSNKNLFASPALHQAPPRWQLCSPIPPGKFCTLAQRVAPSLWWSCPHCGCWRTGPSPLRPCCSGEWANRRWNPMSRHILCSSAAPDYVLGPHCCVKHCPYLPDSHGSNFWSWCVLSNSFCTVEVQSVHLGWICKPCALALVFSFGKIIFSCNYPFIFLNHWLNIWCCFVQMGFLSLCWMLLKTVLLHISYWISILPLFCKRMGWVVQTVLESIVNLGLSLKRTELGPCPCGRPGVMSPIKYFCCSEDLWEDCNYLFVA